MGDANDRDEKIIIIDDIDDPVLAHADAVQVRTLELLRAAGAGIGRQRHDPGSDPLLDVAGVCGELLDRCVG